MVLLKNNTGFPVQLPFKIGEKRSLAPRDGVKVSAEEYERIKKDHPLVLKGLLVFNLAGGSAGANTPDAKKAKKSTVKTKAKGSEGKSEAKTEGSGL